MAQIPDHITHIIQKYLAALQAHHIPVQHVFLFGSYARGNYTEWSDIDLAIVANIFEGNRMDDRHKIQKITGSGDMVRDTCSLSGVETSTGVPFDAAQGTHHVHITTTEYLSKKPLC